jgi:hypothetical protein
LFSSYALGFMAALPVVDERVVGRTAAAGAGFAAGRATAPRRREAPAAAPAATDTTDAATVQQPAAPGTDTGAAPRTRTGRFFRRRRATTRT